MYRWMTVQSVAMLSGLLVGLLAETSQAQRFLPDLRQRATGAESNEIEEIDEIETDRDSFTPATTTVGRRRTIVESSYSFIDNRRVADTHSLPELLIRYGITDRVELRLGGNYEIGGAGNPISGNVPDDLPEEPGLEEETNVSYGLKIKATEQSDWMPQSAFIITGLTPVNGEASSTDFAGVYVAGWTFANRWTWDSAVRYSTGSLEDDDFSVWSPSSVLKVPFCERWKGHIEYFGVFSDGRRQRETTQQFISPGVHYLFNSNFELGTRFGWGLNEDTPSFFVNIGGGIRY